MTPAQVKAILDQHDGAAGDPEGPDSTGLTTYRAADGAWVVAKANGDIVSQGSSPGNVTGGAQASPAKTGVGTYTQAELEARVAQNPGLVYQGQKQKTKPGAYGMPPTPVAVVSWKDPKTNEVVEAEVGDDGTYSVTQDGPGGKTPARTAAASTATAASGATVHIEGTPDPSKPGGFDNERPVKVTRDVQGNQVGLAVPLAGKDLEDWRTDRERSRNPGNKTDAQIKTEATAAEAAKPKPALTYTTINGQRYTTQTTPGVDGKPPTIQHFGPDGQPIAALPTEANADTPTTVTRGGKTYVQHSVKRQDGTSDVYFTLPGSTARVELPAEPDKTAFAAEPAGAPPPNDTPGQITQGLRTYSSWLNDQVLTWQRTKGASGVSPTDATKLMDQRLAAAKSVMEEQSGLASTQSGIRGQDITQRGQTLVDTSGRRQTAESLFKGAMGLLDQAKNLGPGGAPILNKLINDVLHAGMAYVGSAGGLKDSPEIPTVGFLDQVRSQSQQGIASAASGGPQIFAPRPVTAPTPDPAGQNAGAGTGEPPSRGMLPPTDPAMAEAQRQQAAAAQSVPVVNNPIDTSPITPPPDPNAAPTGMTPRFLQEARYGPSSGFDPAQAAAELAQRLGIPPEIMQAAHRGLYG